MPKVNLTHRSIQSLVHEGEWMVDYMDRGSDRDSGLTAIYDRHCYDAEKREVLERWAGRLDAILAGPWGAQTASQHSQGFLG